MKTFFVLALLLSGATNAETLVTKIHELDLPTGKETGALVLIQTQGRVLRISEHSKLIEPLKQATANKSWVELTLSNQNEIISFKVLHSEATPEKNKRVSLPTEYIPTVIDSRDVLNKFLNTLTHPDRFYKRSQCFRRAHVWAYDLFNSEEKVNSMKVVVFFTRKYIREYRYDWWFHIAPFIYFMRDGTKYEVVLDKTYFPDGAVELNDWATAFMENNAKCPVIEKYQDYENAPADAYCMVRKVPMFYYSPAQIEKLDKENIPKNEFDPADIADAGTEMWRRKW